MSILRDVSIEKGSMEAADLRRTLLVREAEKEDAEDEDAVEDENEEGEEGEDAPVHETSPPMPLLSDLPRREDRRKGCAPGFRAARSHTRAAEISTVRVERMKLMMTM